MTDPSVGSSSPNWASLISNDVTPILVSDVPASIPHDSNSTMVPPEATHDLPLLMDSLNAGMSPYAPVFHPTGSYASHLLQLEQTAQSNPQLLPPPPPHPVDPNLDEYCDRSSSSDMPHLKPNHIQSAGLGDSNENSCTVDLTIRMTPTCHISYPNQTVRGNWRDTPFREFWSEEAVEASQLQMQLHHEYWRQLHQQVAAAVESQQHLRPISPSRNLLHQIEGDGIGLPPQLPSEQIPLMQEHWQHMDHQLAAFATQMPPHIIPPPLPLEYWRDLIAFTAQAEVPQVPHPQQDSALGLPLPTAMSCEHWKDVDQLANTGTAPFQVPMQDLTAPLPFELAPENVPQVTVFVPPPLTILPSPQLLLGPPQFEWKPIENIYPPEELVQQLHREHMRDSEQQAASSVEQEFLVQQEVCPSSSQSEWLSTPKLTKITVSVEPQVRPGPTHTNFWPANEQAVFFARKYWQNMNQKSSVSNVQTPGQPIPLEQIMWRDMEQTQEAGGATPSHLLPEPVHREWWQATAFIPQQGQTLIHTVQPMQSVEPKQLLQPENPVHSVPPVEPMIPVQSVQPVESEKSAEPVDREHAVQLGFPTPPVQPVQRSVESKVNWSPYAYANSAENGTPSEDSNSVEKHSHEEPATEASVPKAPINRNGAPSPDYPSFEEFARQVSECSLSSSEYIATLRNLIIRAHNLMLPLLRGRFANMSQVQMAAYTTAILEVTPLHPSLFVPSNISRPWMGNGGLLPPCHPHSLTPEDLARINARPLRVHAATQTDYHCWCMHISMFPPPPLPRAAGNGATHFTNGARMMSPCSSGPLSFWGRSVVPMHHPHTHSYVQAHQLQRPHGTRYGYRYTYSVPSRFTATGTARMRPPFAAMCGAAMMHMAGSPAEDTIPIEHGNNIEATSSFPIPAASSVSVDNEQQQQIQEQQQQQQQQQQQAPLQHVGTFVTRCSSPSIVSVDLSYSMAENNELLNNSINKNLNQNPYMGSDNLPNEQLKHNLENLSASINRQLNLEENAAQIPTQEPINEAPQYPKPAQAEDNSNSKSSGKKVFVKRCHDLFLQPTGPVMPSMPSVHYYSGTLAQRGRQLEMPQMIYDMNGDYSENAHYFQFLPNVNMNMSNAMPDVRVIPTDVPEHVCPVVQEILSPVSSGLVVPAAENVHNFKPNVDIYPVLEVRENTGNDNFAATNANLLNIAAENANPVPNANEFMNIDFLAASEDSFNGFISSEEFTNGNMTADNHTTTECESIKKFSTAKL